MPARESRSSRRIDRASPPPERVEEGAELPTGLIDLRVRTAVRDDPGAGEEGRPVVAELGAPQGDGPFTVAARIDPADGPGVRPPSEGFQLADRCERDVARLTRHGGRRVPGPAPPARARSRLPRAA